MPETRVMPNRYLGPPGPELHQKCGRANDFLFGGGGNDYLSGGNGDDVLRSGTGDGDTVDGGYGVDTADYLDSWTGVYVDLTSGYGWYGTASGERLFDIENLN